MRTWLLALAFTGFLNQALAQTVVDTIPGEHWCPNDTFVLKFKNFPKSFPYRVSRENNESPGTDAALDEYAVLCFGNDSLRLNYHNHIPYAHIIFVHFASPKGKTTLRFHFNDLASYFPLSYMEKNEGGTQVDIPEPYELANIIWTLSPAGQQASDLNKGGAYYERVVNYFKPYMDHPIFKQLDFRGDAYAEKYYDFRENSFAFNFRDPRPGAKDTRLLFNGPYYYVYGDELADSSLFGKLKPLVEDFAKKSNFRKFYKDNLAYYQSAIARERALLPLKKMWAWLEDQFPGIRYQSYRVVFSPLIGGSHSTQRYSTRFKGGRFGENVMFVCGTDRYDQLQDISDTVREGLMSGIVFTEIDHNYVNPVSNRYGRQIDSIFSNRQVWAKTGNSSDYYDSPVSVFNEYMTHAAFCLYIQDSYEKPVADYVVAARESLMVERRNFIRFREFNQALMQIRKEHPGVKLADLYPYLLDWCRDNSMIR